MAAPALIAPMWRLVTYPSSQAPELEPDGRIHGSTIAPGPRRRSRRALQQVVRPGRGRRARRPTGVAGGSRSGRSAPDLSGLERGRLARDLDGLVRRDVRAPPSADRVREEARRGQDNEERATGRSSCRGGPGALGLRELPSTVEGVGTKEEVADEVRHEHEQQPPDPPGVVELRSRSSITVR